MSEGRQFGRLVAISKTIVALSAMLMLSVGACEDDCSGPEDHTVCRDGAAHKSGADAPAENCNSCHGASAPEDIDAPSCDSCHN